MNVLVSNVTPFVVWRFGGGLVGACRTKEHALGIMSELKSAFPANEYFCRDVDGEIVASTDQETAS